MGDLGPNQNQKSNTSNFCKDVASEDRYHCLAILGSVAINNELMLRVVVPVTRPAVTDLFTLDFDLAYARFASATYII